MGLPLDSWKVGYPRSVTRTLHRLDHRTMNAENMCHFQGPEQCFLPLCQHVPLIWFSIHSANSCPSHAYQRTYKQCRMAMGASRDRHFTWRVVVAALYLIRCLLERVDHGWVPLSWNLTRRKWVTMSYQLKSKERETIFCQESETVEVHATTQSWTSTQTHT